MENNPPNLAVPETTGALLNASNMSSHPMHINRESARMRVKSHGEGQSVDISSSAGVDFYPPDVKKSILSCAVLRRNTPLNMLFKLNLSTGERPVRDDSIPKTPTQKELSS